MVNFVTAPAYYFCLALPAAFTQPRDLLLAEPCRCITTHVVDEEVEGGVEAGEEGGEAHEHVGDAPHHARVTGRRAPQLLVKVGNHLKRTRRKHEIMRAEKWDLGCVIRVLLNERYRNGL